MSDEAVDSSDAFGATGATEDMEMVRPTFVEPAETPERAPKRNIPRKSGARFFELAATFLGQTLEQTGADMPVGRVVKFQAPITGNKIDELIAHSFLDKWLQPLFSGSEKAEGLGAIIMLPLMVGMVERNPAMMPMLEGIMRSAMQTTLVEMAPVIRKQRAQEKKVFSAVKDLNMLLEIPEGMDPFEAMMASIFNMPQTNQESVDNG